MKFTAFKISVLGFAILFISNKSFSQTGSGVMDTLITSAIIYEGDTLEAKTLAGVYIYSYRSNLTAKAKWTRLRNAVYVTYPYAKRASVILNDINVHVTGHPDKAYVSKYINRREKELKKEFTDPITNLSVYQGKVLMKLINRETGNNCYNILKEFKGGVAARFWQTVAFFFGSNLKQPYDPKVEDVEIEIIVKEVKRMYGHPI